MDWFEKSKGICLLHLFINASCDQNNTISPSDLGHLRNPRKQNFESVEGV